MITHKPKIGIISYCDKIRTYASVNHQYYADRHNYTYIYDIAPTDNSVFKNKIEKILKYIDLFDWVFWIDDDAFFTQYDTPLETFIKKGQKSDLIFCESPVNLEGGWTYLSSGNFFLKNSHKTKLWLNKCLEADLNSAELWWDSKKYGIFTGGDQDIMVHLLMSDRQFKGSFHTTLSWKLFNTRPYHFDKNINEHFLVHFTGTEKLEQSLQFSKKFGLSPAAIPKTDFNKYNGIYHPK